jgi:hypothetical protein
MPPTPNPWKEFYEQRGEQPPAPGQLPASGPAEPRPAPIVWEEKVETEIMDAEEEVRRMEAARRRRREELLVFGELLLGALLAVALITGTVEFYRWWHDDQPPADQLSARAGLLAAEALHRLSTPQLPLALDSARPVLRRQPDSEHAEYEVVVVLRLRADLYVSATSNGAQPYLQLRQSVAEASDLALRHYTRLADTDLPSRPELPPLLELTAHAGGRTTLHLPLRAERFGWHWRLEVPAGADWTPDRPLAGLPRGNYPADALVFGPPVDRATIRRLQQEARDYVLAVRRAFPAN